MIGQGCGSVSVSSIVPAQLLDSVSVFFRTRSQAGGDTVKTGDFASGMARIPLVFGCSPERFAFAV